MCGLPDRPCCYGGLSGSAAPRHPQVLVAAVAQVDAGAVVQALAAAVVQALEAAVDTRRLGAAPKWSARSARKQNHARIMKVKRYSSMSTSHNIISWVPRFQTTQDKIRPFGT